MSLHYLAKHVLRTHSTFSKLPMMFVGVSKFGKTKLIIVDPGVKINGTYCRDVLLTEQLLSVMREIFSEFLIFQQHSAPAHGVYETISLHFTRPVAPKSPDLTRLTINFGEKCSSGSIRRMFMTLMN